MSLNSGEIPSVAVVIPAFGHSVLLWEALSSLLRQDIKARFGVVMVNDGCSHRHTDLAGLAMREYLQDRFEFVYIAQENKGLSAARNAGIEFVLKSWPSCKGIFFLDADNYLEPHALRVMNDLVDCEEADWFYQDFDFFGLRSHTSLDGDYSPLMHSYYNMCDAGSLVRLCVFRDGLRFDPALRKGYEDWDFWLQALERGYVGRHEPALGLRYRKRPDSMLASSRRAHDEILSLLWTKHPWMTDARVLGELQRREAPRYGLLRDDGFVTLFTDVREISTGDASVVHFETAFWRWAKMPHAYPFPPFMISGNSENLNQAIGPWIVWDLERRLSKASLSVVRLALGAALEIDTTGGRPTEPGGGGAFAMVRSEFLREVVTQSGHPARIDANVSRSERTVTAATTPGLSLVPAESAFSAVAAILRRSDLASHSSIDWRNGTSTGPLRHRSPLAIEEQLGITNMFPVRRVDKRHIGFVLPIVEFGGVERVAFRVAEAFRSSGYSCHLFVMGSRRISLGAGAETIFETISWLDGAGLLDWSGSDYFGTGTSRWGSPECMKEALGMFTWLDCVVNCHSPDFNKVAPNLRARGVVCVSYQHVLDYSEWNRPKGHPLLALAYEHCYDLIACCSYGLGRWLQGHGIPSDKIVVVPNATGHIFAQADIEASRIERMNPLVGSVNVMYMGRFDRQKGVGRLIEMIKLTSGNPSIRWRCVGGSVLSSSDLTAQLRAVIETEEPMFEATEVAEALRWADVLVVPSEFEGLPLIVVEAMTLGCVVIATNTGSIGEIIDHEDNGYLFSPDVYTESAVSIIECLLGQPELRVRVAGAASSRAVGRKWPESCRDLLDQLDGLLTDRETRRSGPSIPGPRAKNGG
ncbi:glycosyltransferase [Hansschlegelia beijingensis]